MENKYIISDSFIEKLVNTPFGLNLSGESESYRDGALRGLVAKQHQVIDMINDFPSANVFDVNDFTEKVKFAINATDLKDTYSCGFRNALRYALSLVDGKDPEYEECEKSTVDAVEVVRCKDCKHKFDRKIFGNIMCGRTAIIKNGEPYGLIATGDNQFCSYGESKTSLPEATRQTVLNSFMKGSED